VLFRSGPNTVFDVEIHDRKSSDSQLITDLVLPMPGLHNVSNVTAAIAIANELGLGADDIRKGIAAFGGVKRRFTHTGCWNGVNIYDDYAHHPVEIKAVLQAARDAASGRVITIMQPHRYTRLESLFDDFCSCFNDADTVLVAPVYEAGESPIEGFNSETLVTGLRSGGHRDARLLNSPDDIPGIIADQASEGDLVIFLGAGSITQWAHALPDQLANL